MTKETLSVVLGLLYSSFITMQVLLLFTLQMKVYDCSIWTQYTYWLTGPGVACLFGSFLLVPSVVLSLVYIFSEQRFTLGRVGIAIGIPGMFLWLAGTLEPLVTFWIYTRFSATILFLITLSMMLSGNLLFWRTFEIEEVSEQVVITPYKTPPPEHSIPETQTPRTQTPGPPCSRCNRAARFIPEYNKFYCDHCKKYI